MLQGLITFRPAPLLLAACLGSGLCLATAQAASPPDGAAPAARHRLKGHELSAKAAAEDIAAAESKPLLDSNAPPTPEQRAAAAAAERQAVNPIYQMKIGRMQCGSHEFMDVKQEDAHDQSILVTWKGRHYLLTRKPTTTGAYHFDDAKAGLVMIQIPAKSMLFDKKHMTRLADDCNPMVASR
ncbi:MAG: hypothetical protein KGL42_09020 [Betaproteobacteria bacterium]|nr:hypothetical protein [Betaproteobacteria bacterium]